MSPFNEVIINRSFRSRAWSVKTRIPSEHTFSVVVRSAASGSRMVEIWSGIVTSIRFSSLPDRKGICELTFPTGLCRPAPGGAEPNNCRNQAEQLRWSLSHSHTSSQAWVLACVSCTSASRRGLCFWRAGPACALNSPINISGGGINSIG